MDGGCIKATFINSLEKQYRRKIFPSGKILNVAFGHWLMQIEAEWGENIFIFLCSGQKDDWPVQVLKEMDREIRNKEVLGTACGWTCGSEHKVWRFFISHMPTRKQPLLKRHQVGKMTSSIDVTYSSSSDSQESAWQEHKWNCYDSR